MKKIVSIISSIAFCTVLANAEDKPATPPAGDKPATEKPAAPEAKKANVDKAFGKKDSNNDGSLTKEEFTAGAKDATRAEKAFARLDKDSDGKLTKEEFAARQAARKGNK